MGQPRFLYVSGVWTNAGWSPEADPAGDGRPRGTAVGWRLLGRNNRDLGRSPLAYGDLVECQAAVRRLPLELLAAKPHFRTTGTAGLWSWRLALDGVPVAVAARAYHRQRECHDSLDQFLAAAQVASSVPRPAHPVPRVRAARPARILAR